MIMHADLIAEMSAIESGRFSLLDLAFRYVLCPFCIILDFHVVLLDVFNCFPRVSESLLSRRPLDVSLFT